MEEINIDIKVGQAGRDSLQQLKQDIKDATAEVIKLRSAEVIDEEAIISATRRAGELRDQFSAANDAIKTMTAGDDFEKLGNNVGLLSGQVNNLDFGGAAESAKQFTETLKGVNPKKMKEDFGAFANSIGGLSKQFIKLGISILANPILLIAAIIAGIVVAIVLLKDKLVIMEKAFDILMIPVRALIQGLKDLTDWMGLTSFASDEMADKLIENNERISASTKNSNDKLVGEYSRKIALMKANGEDTSAIEIAEAKRVASVNETMLKATAKSIDALIGKQVDKTKAEKEEIQKQIDEKRKQYEQETQIYLNSANNIQVLIDSNAKKEREEDAKNNEKALSDRAKAIAATAAQRAKAQQEAIEALKRGYEVERAEIQIGIDSMEDGLEKELAINEEKQRIAEQDLQFTKFNEEEKARLRLTFQSEREIADKKSFEKRTKERLVEQEKEIAERIKFNQELRDMQATYDDYILEMTGTEGEKRTKAIEDSRNKQLANIQSKFELEIDNDKLNYAQKEQLRREHEVRMANIIKIANDLQVESDKKTREDEIVQQAEKFVAIVELVSGFVTQIGDLLNAGIENRIAGVEDEKDRTISNLDSQQQQELSIVGLSESQKTAINNRFAKKKYQAELKAFNETEKLKKKQFENDKAFRMVGVIMDTAAGIGKVVAAYAATPPLMVAMVAATAAIGIGQLAVIGQQKYKGASGPSAPSISSGGGSSSASAPSQPNLSLTENGERQNQVGSVGNVEGKETPTFIVKAVVSETEITDTQERISKIKTSGEL